jgi:transcriptional regulator with XRE-family HTH domain
VTISDQLREILRSRGLSAYQLGELAGVNRSVITRFTAGEDLKLSTVDRLAGALGLRLTEVATRRSAGRRKPTEPVRRPLTGDMYVTRQQLEDTPQLEGENFAERSLREMIELPEPAESAN